MTSLNSMITNAQSADELLKILDHVQPDPVGFTLGRKFSYRKSDGAQDLGSVYLRTILKKAREVESKASSQEIVTRLIQKIKKLDADATHSVVISLDAGNCLVNVIRWIVALIARAGNIKDSKTDNLTHFRDLNEVLEKFNIAMKDSSFDAANVSYALTKISSSIDKPIPKEFIPFLKLYLPIPYFWQTNATLFATALCKVNLSERDKKVWTENYEKVFEDTQNCVDLAKVNVQTALKFSKETLYRSAEYCEKSQKNMVDISRVEVQNMYKYAVKNGWDPERLKGGDFSDPKAVRGFYSLYARKDADASMDAKEAFEVAEVFPDPVRAKELYRLAYTKDNGFLDRLKDGDENAQAVYKEITEKS